MFHQNFLVLNSFFLSFICGLSEVENKNMALIRMQNFGEYQNVELYVSSSLEEIVKRKK